MACGGVRNNNGGPYTYGGNQENGYDQRRKEVGGEDEEYGARETDYEVTDNSDIDAGDSYADDTAPGPTGNMGTDEQALLDEINRVRRQHGLPEVQLSPQLNGYAQRNDATNNQTGVLDHHHELAPGMGEITAFVSNGMTAQDAVRMWLESDGHRKILLDPDQTHVGVSIDGNFATADFI